MLSLLTIILYLFLYTPLKRESWLNTSVGAIPGAIPPLGGWTAATNSLEWGGIAVFLILFFWQHPHFYSIAYMYKEDYKMPVYKCCLRLIMELKGQYFIFSCMH